MRTQRKKELEAAGWKVGSAAEFLGLEAAEQAMVQLRLGLGKSLRDDEVYTSTVLIPVGDGLLVAVKH